MRKINKILYREIDSQYVTENDITKASVVLRGSETVKLNFRLITRKT